MLRENTSVNLVKFRETMNRIDEIRFPVDLRDVIGDSKNRERTEKHTEVLA